MCIVTHLQASGGGYNLKKFYLGPGWEKGTELGMLIGSSKTRTCVGIRGWHQNGWKEAGSQSHAEEIWMKHVDLDAPTSFLDHVYFGCTQREC